MNTLEAIIFRKRGGGVFSESGSVHIFGSIPREIRISLGDEDAAFMCIFRVFCTHDLACRVTGTLSHVLV